MDALKPHVNWNSYAIRSKIVGMTLDIGNKPDTSSLTRTGRHIPGHFILRRLHSLLGVVPLSLYLIIHLIIGATAASGKPAYDAVQSTITRIPLLVPFEIIVIILPLLFHAIYGITIAVRSRNNPFMYPFTANWRYMAQRYTGYYLAVFLMIHTYFLWLHVRFSATGEAAFGVSAYDVVRELMKDHTFMVLYTLGVTAAAFHCGNGLAGFCITWGIATDARTRRIAVWAGAIVFLVLAYVGNVAVQAFY